MLTPHVVQPVNITPPTLWEQARAFFLNFIRVAPSTLVLAFLLLGVL